MFYKVTPKAVLVKVLGVIHKSLDHYYYDVMVEDERKILKVPPTVYRVIQANRTTDQFVFERDGILVRCRPAGMGSN